MKSASRCKCDECRSAEMVLQELDRIAPVMIETRGMELTDGFVK